VLFSLKGRKNRNSTRQTCFGFGRCGTIHQSGGFMKSAAIVFALFFSAQAFAAGTLPGQTFCVADGEKGRVTLQETTNGVEIHLFDIAFKSAGNIGNFPVGTKFDHAMMIENATLQQVTSTRVAKDSLVSLLLSMPDEGDYDMVWAYAAEFLNKLQCK
jgi:hypothetical protein